ncbi:hypothetical protein BDV96DRAFT_653081 [Lophiotrema nucula]|uniref:Uncharacterized protein n=1 Tax=Lophiotrema nucula TaxID=690887 RepID=A0A6A5YPZ0_9PLEO|nr:hypothetical protein BDV96DRAFT_653081 [Lophiotrema nucula]
MGMSARREAEAIRDVLTDPQKRANYDANLEVSDSDSDSDPNIYPHFNEAKMEAKAPEAQFRYANTDAGTEFDLEISGWNLSFNLTSKYSFKGEMTELSGRQVDAMAIGFQIALGKNTSSSEWEDPTVNDIAIRVAQVPNFRRVAGLETMYKELSASSRSLIIRISSELSILGPTAYVTAPFEFGFDFDMNPSSLKPTARPATFPVATHLIFSRKEFPEYLKTTHTSQKCPEYAIKQDEALKGLDTFVDLGSEYWMRVRYGGVAMYRLAAVGHRLGDEGRKPMGGYRFC